MRKHLLASALFLAAQAPFTAALAQSADPAVLTPERVFANPSLSGPVARGVSLSPDGELVAFLRSREDDVDVLDLWAAPTGEGEPFKLIDARAWCLMQASCRRPKRPGASGCGFLSVAWSNTPGTNRAATSWPRWKVTSSWPSGPEAPSAA